MFCVFIILFKVLLRPWWTSSQEVLYCSRNKDNVPYLPITIVNITAESFHNFRVTSSGKKLDTLSCIYLLWWSFTINHLVFNDWSTTDITQNYDLVQTTICLAFPTMDETFMRQQWWRLDSTATDSILCTRVCQSSVFSRKGILSQMLLCIYVRLSWP